MNALLLYANLLLIKSGPFLIPGDPGTGIDPVPPYIETTPKPEEPEEENVTVPCKAIIHIPNYANLRGVSRFSGAALDFIHEQNMFVFYFWAIFL